MRRICTLAVVAAVTLLPGVAGATVGGPSTLEVLGYAPADGKVYLLRHNEDSSDELPQLVYVPLRGSSVGREIEVKSWYGADRDSDEAREAFEVRLAKLKRRLRQPARRRPKVKLRAWKKRDIEWTAPWDPSFTKAGEQWRVRVAASGARAEATLDSFGCLPWTETCARVRVHEAVGLPLADATLVIVESLGLADETGYAFQQALLLPAPSTPDPESEPRKK